MTGNFPKSRCSVVILVDGVTIISAAPLRALTAQLVSVVICKIVDALVTSGLPAVSFLPLHLHILTIFMFWS